MNEKHKELKKDREKRRKHDIHGEKIPSSKALNQCINLQQFNYNTFRLATLTWRLHLALLEEIWQHNPTIKKKIFSHNSSSKCPYL